MDKKTKSNILKRRVEDFHEYMIECLQDGIGEDLEIKEFVEVALETYLEMEELNTGEITKNQGGENERQNETNINRYNSDIVIL
jgi:pullulanase/glycogen debranching enzyme